MAAGGTPCPHCGKTFKQLSRHKCKQAPQPPVSVKDEDTEPEVLDAKSRSATMNREEHSSSSSPVTQKNSETCPYCKKPFKQLSRHKCKMDPSTSPARETTDASSDDDKEATARSREAQDVPRNVRPEETCPRCSKTFKQLYRHRCKMPPGPNCPSPTETADNDANTEECAPRNAQRTRKNTEAGQTCPDCKKTFKQLFRHKCKMTPDVHDTSPGFDDDATTLENSSTTALVQGNVEERRQICPHCKKTFKQLYKHKCKMVSANIDGLGSVGDQQLDSNESSTEACAGSTKAPETQKATSEGQACPSCGKTFKQLSRHRCKNDPGYSTDTPNSNSRQTPCREELNPSDSGKQQCPNCGKFFKQLRRHKCKASLSSGESRSPTSCFPHTGSVAETLPGASPGLGDDGQTNAGQKQNRNLAAGRPQYCLTCREPHEPCPRQPCLPRDNRTESGDSGYSSVSGTSCGTNLERTSDTEDNEDKYDYGEEEGKDGEEDEEEDDERGASCERTQTSRPTLPHAARTPSSQTRTTLIKIPLVKDRSEATRNQKPNVLFTLTNDQTSSSSIATGTGGRNQVKSPSISPSDSRPLSFPTKETAGIPDKAEKPPQDERGYKTLVDVEKLTEKANEVMKLAGINVSAGPAPNDHLLKKFIKDEVELPQRDISDIADVSRSFRKKIDDNLKEKTSWAWDYLNSGSHYDGTKVTRADELDCMFFPKIPASWMEVVHTGTPAEFRFLKLKQIPFQDTKLQKQYDEVKSLCVDAKYPHFISSDAFRAKIFKVFQAAVDDFRRAKVHPHAKPGSPSFQVELLVIPSSEGGGLKPVDVDLLPSIRFEGWPANCTLNHIMNLPDNERDKIINGGYYVIPKECQRDEYKKVKHLLWRLSFSPAEKELTKYADTRISRALRSNPEGKTCWKRVLRIMKRTLELIKGSDSHKSNLKPNELVVKLKTAVEILRTDFKRTTPEFEIQKFTTFQVRTLMWTEFYITCTGVELWAENKLSDRLHLALNQMLKMVSGRTHVHHFFIPDMDIMGEVPRDEREFLYIMFSIAQKLFRTKQD